MQLNLGMGTVCVVIVQANAMGQQNPLSAFARYEEKHFFSLCSTEATSIAVCLFHSVVERRRK